MEEVLGGEAVTQRTVECCGQHFRIAGGGQVDQRSGGRGDGKAVRRLTVDRRQVHRAMHEVSDALPIGAPWHHEVIRRFQMEAVEADQRCGRGLGAAGTRAEPGELFADFLIAPERDWRVDASMVDEKGSRAICRSQAQR
jgi:hypothetical protein